MSRKFCYVFLLLLPFLSFTAVGANVSLPSKCKAFMPKILSEKILKESDAEKLLKSRDFFQSGTSTNKYWYVFSDRDDNTTYTEPSEKSQTYSKLTFNQRVYIAEIRGRFALVYDDPKIGSGKYPEISSAAKCYGWVSLDKLLLWESCLANEKGIYNKALFCVNLDQVGDNIGKGYLNPSDRSKGFQLSTDMNFYFVYKKEGDMVLLGKQSKLNGSYSYKMLLCWVSSESYVHWNQRSCLEPTWRQEDAEYFADKGIEVKIYGDKSMTGSVASSIKFTRRESKTHDQYLYRMDGQELRFPILDGTTSKIYNMSTFSTLGGKAVGTDLRKSQAARFDESKKQALDDMLNINIGIVIDGTKSMEPYYSSVQSAIKEGLAYFQTNERIRVGVVIYRDYTDGEGLCEVLPLTDAKHQIDRINEFLEKGGSYGIRSSRNDITQTEALYYGLNKALDTLRFDERQSNLLLVVGDCGNDPQDKRFSDETQIVDKLVEKRVSLMGFQVQNKNQAAFNSFNNQILKIMRTSLDRTYKKLRADIKVDPYKVSDDNNKQIQIGYDYKPNCEERYYIGSHRYATANVNDGKMNPAILSQHLEIAISKFQKTIQTQKDQLASADMSFFDGGANLETGNMTIQAAFVQERLGTDKFKMAKETNSILNFAGYTNKKDQSGREFFKPVLFISLEEFDVLLKRLSPVYEAARQASTSTSSAAAKDRTPYIEALKALLRSLTQDKSEAEMAKMSNADITMMIGGLNESAAALEGYTLDELSSQSAVSPQKYLSIVQDFARKYERLNHIRKSKSYKYIRDFNGVKYYWIPIENLP